MVAWLSILSALTALVGVALGPYVQTRIAKRQIRATVVTASRQVWINALRDDLVEYMALTAEIGNSLDMNPQAARDPRVYPDVMKKLDAAARIHLRITLRVNRDETEHQILLQRIEDMKMQPTLPDVAKLYNAARERLIEQAQKVLKQEWERVKRGE